jgi:thiamine transport system permease protein
MSRQQALAGLLYLIPLGFLAVFYFYPLTSILVVSLAPAGSLDISALARLLNTDYYLRILWFTIWQAALSTLLTVLLALPGAYVLARYRFSGKWLLQALTTIPFVLPTVVVANAFTALLGPNSRLNLALMAWLGSASPPIDLQFTLWMILLAHVFYNYAVVLRIVSGFWANLSPRLEEAGRLLGARPWDVWWHITLPLLAPAIAAAAALVFIFCFTSFGVILILGGPRFATLEVEIYRQTVNLFNLPVAAALSLVQLLFTFLLMWGYTRLQSRLAVQVELRARQHSQRPFAGRRARLLVAGNVMVMVGFLVTPLLALVERSLTLGGGLTLRYYAELFVNRRTSLMYVPPIQAGLNSLVFACGTVLLALALGLISASLLARPARRVSLRRLQSLADPLLMLPLGTSAITLGFGFIIALDRPPLNLRASPWLIPLAHTLVAFPFVIRSLLPALRSIRPSIREAAAVLGAGPLRLWREIDLGEFGATALIARPQTPTLPVAIYRFLGQPGTLNYGQALAMSTLLMLICGAGMALIERFRGGGVAEF